MTCGPLSAAMRPSVAIGFLILADVSFREVLSLSEERLRSGRQHEQGVLLLNSRERDLHHTARVHGDFEHHQIPVIDPVADGKEEFDHAQRSAENLPETMWRGTSGVALDFLPKWKFQLSTFLVGLVTLVVSSLFFILYYDFVYHDDRSAMQDVPKWQANLQHVRENRYEEDPNAKPTPDIIIVLHHPSHENEDDNTEVSFDVIDRIAVSGNKNQMDNLNAMKELAEKGHVDLTDVRNFGHGVQRFGEAVRAFSPIRGDAEVPAEEKPTRKMVRKAILKDLSKVLPQSFGVQCEPFKSIDGDEMFMELTLKSRKSIMYYLARDRIRLPLNRELCGLIPDAEGETIKLNWVEPACSPPLMPFDPTVVRALYDSIYGARGIPFREGENEEIKVFKNYPSSGKETCISGVECIRILYDELSGCIDVGAACDEGLVVGWFPVHNPISIQDLQAVWASWRFLVDWTFVQPIPYLREYFGARMAFLFAWNGVVCKAMVPLILLATMWLATVSIAKWANYAEINERQVVGFSMVLCIWSKITFNIWSREQDFFQELWGMRSSTDEGLTRPQFRGTLMPSPLNERLQERQYPASRAKARRATAALITSLFCALVFFMVMGTLLLFSGRPARIVPWVLTIMIKIFQFIFQFVVKALTEFENHKFQEDYFNSYLWKLFLFEFVNNYSAFFFLTVKNSWTDGHDSRGLDEPQAQVSMTLMLLAVCSIMQVPSQLLYVQVKLWWEDHCYRKEFGEEPPKRSFCEEQGKMITIDEPYEVQNMMTLVIALGYVLLFGGVAPKVVLYSFVVFVVQLRAFAVLLTTSAQRPFPQRALGIGNWEVVVVFLMNCGVIYSGFLFVAFGRTFKDSTILAKMTGYVIFLVGMYVFWGIIDLFFPGQCPNANLLAKRRNYITRMIMKLTSARNLAEVKEQSMAEVDLQYADAIDQEDWGQIQRRERSALEQVHSRKMLRNSFTMMTPRAPDREPSTPRSDTTPR